jgi:hypothetical protein
VPPRKKGTTRSKASRRAAHRATDEREFERLVAAGVRRFILQHETIGKFYATLRTAALKKAVPPHPLSALVLSRIVREAMLKRTKARHK